MRILKPIPPADEKTHGSATVAEPIAKDFDAIADATETFDNEILPLAKKRRLIAGDLTRVAFGKKSLDTLMANLGETSDWTSSESFRLVARELMPQLYLAASGLHLLRTTASNSHTEWRKAKLIASVHWCHGYLTAVENQGLESSRHGAEGRRRIGATSKEKVRDAAAVHRAAGISKEKAALDIAQDVSLSPSTIRKLLSELFPGSKWKSSV